MPDFHAVPAPRQVIVVPSPISHRTRVGVAVAVTDTPGTDAVAVRAPHVVGSTHSHTGTRTSRSTFGLGFARIRGDGNGRSADARRANTAGFTASGGFAIHCGAVPSTLPPVPQMYEYQAPLPGSTPAGGG